MSALENLTQTHSSVAEQERRALLGQRGVVLWLTGLSGSGKSTLAYALEKRLIQDKHLCFVLDGDNVRLGLCKDLTFKPEDRSENIRRVSEVAALFAGAGLITITSFISPYRKDRQNAKSTAPQGQFIEVYLDVSVDVCEVRDPKGLYKKARAGDIPNFTGISAPYEAPDSPDLSVNTSTQSVDECVDQIMSHLRDHGFFEAKVPKPKAP